MRTSTKTLLLSLAPGALAATLVACSDDANGAAGAIRGLIVDASGNPLPNARVVLDELAGTATLTDERGVFALSGVEVGPHTLYALHNELRQAAVRDVEVPAGDDLELAPVMLAACDGQMDLEPCTWPEGKPVLSRGLFPSLELDVQSGEVLAASLDVSGESHDERIFFKLSIPGDFSEGGTLLLQDPTPLEAASLLSLTDLAGVHFYVLDAGVLDVTVKVTDSGHQYQVIGTDLVFLYQDWNGLTDPTYVVEIGRVTLYGQAGPLLGEP